MVFSEPLWLAFALLAIPAALLAVKWFASMSPARRWVSAFIRASLIVLIAMLLAGANRVQQSDRLAVIAVIDASQSVRAYYDAGVGDDGRPIDPQTAIRAWLRAATGDARDPSGITTFDARTATLFQSFARSADDLLGVVVFDARPHAIASPTIPAVALNRSFETPSAEGTDIAEALRLGAAMIPPDAAGRIVLFSDGNETQGDARRAAGELGGSGGLRVPVDVVPLVYRVQREVIVEGVDVPPRAPTRSTVTARVNIRSTHSTSGTLRLFREGREIDISGGADGRGRRISLEPGMNTELVEVTLPDDSLHRFRAVYEPDTIDGRLDDTNLANNIAEGFTLTPAEGSVLIVDGVGQGEQTGAGAILAETLRENELRVELVAPDAMPRDMLELQRFDVVILQNVPAEDVPPPAQRALVSFVRDLGGGLVMSGGRDSFGPGGWQGSAIEPILPVRLDLPEQMIQPEAAVVFIIDRSGSMSAGIMGSSRNRQQVVNEATAMSIQMLDDNDLVGVIAFDSRADVIQPLAPNTNKDRLASRVMGIAPMGGTDLLPPMREAMRQLSAVDAKLKYCIVLSDGISMNAPLLPPLAAEMRRQGITVTSIAVGDDADRDLLRGIADQGGGEFYYVFNANDVPRVFLRTIRIVRQPLIREQPFQPVLRSGASPLVSGLETPPTLQGLVLTQRRDDPMVVDSILAPDGEPVLSQWNAGLGQVVAFTSDAHGEWSRDWMGWGGYSTMWTNIVRSISRSEAGGANFSVDTEASGGRLAIRVEGTDAEGSPLDLLDMPAVVVSPTGERREVRLSQVGPGRYEGSVEAGDPGNYIVIARPEDRGQPIASVIGGATVAGGIEFRRLRSDSALLDDIAERTGGRRHSMEAPQDARLFDRTGIEPRRALLPLWQTLLFWALVFFMLDVATRRIAWDRYFDGSGGILKIGAAASKREQRRAQKQQAEIERRTAAARRSRRKAAEPVASKAGNEKPAPGKPMPEKVDGKGKNADDGGLLAAKKRAGDRYKGLD